MAKVTKRAVSSDDAGALVDLALAGFTAKTAARGISVGQNERALIKLLGKPTKTRRDQNMGGGRRLTELVWKRKVEVAGTTVEERVDVSWDTKPDHRGVTSIGVTLTGAPAVDRMFRAAFAQTKERLLALYKKGENKSTFRAPGFASEPGFVAVFHYPANDRVAPTLVVNAGVII